MNAGHPEREGEGEIGGAQRIDKWLWFARVVKSRTLAQGLVTGGKVRLNRQRVDKSGTLVRPGDVVTVTAHSRVRVLRMLAAGERRGPPAEARLLFEELTPAREPGSAGTQAPGRGGTRDAGSGRPTKKQRRAIDRLQGE